MEAKDVIVGVAILLAELKMDLRQLVKKDVIVLSIVEKMMMMMNYFHCDSGTNYIASFFLTLSVHRLIV